MNNIAICIPTYKRQVMLKQLIVSISECSIDKSIINNINIVVVDNDADKTAEIVIQDLKAENNKMYDLHYHNYAIKGLANVRNELLSKALEFKPDFIIFIDDDEYVTVNWMNELVKTIVNNNADAARGPVLAKITNPVTKGIAKLLEREKHENNAQLLLWTTGNLILRRTSLETFNVRFDKRFNSTGSEDTFFGIQIAKKGATIFWAANAITYEIIPKKRTQLKWFIGRAYRGGAMFMFILKLEKDYLRIANKILISFLYILAGLLTSIFVLFPIKFRYWGILKLSDGIGALAGLLNIQYNEYK